MPSAVEPERDDLDNDNYHSSSDSDFDAELSASSAVESDDSAEDAGKKSVKTQAKRKTDKDGDVEMGSGDEGIIAQGRKKNRKKKKKKSKGGDGKTKADDSTDSDEGENAAVGVRVRLRSGRGGIEATKKKPPAVGTSTVNIDSVWERMNKPEARQVPRPPLDVATTGSGQAEKVVERQPLKELPALLQTSTPAETITIPHVYTFAGETHTSTKTVPANSSEALAYLAAKEKIPIAPTGPILRRPLARKGLIEPNPSGIINGTSSSRRADLPPSIGGNGAKSLSAEMKVSAWDAGSRKKKDQKLNTVEKSKLDWEKEVERQGLREELEKAEKSGTNYLGRVEFLNRAEDVREEEARRWRMAGKT